ncbi:hypothetical protein MLD38_027793 [Melastoma candidum]|uniref:Uncharacterized protein n=1 Tax=Melastoma candidum TaxID=119954 RepID=A0ACB9P5M6_9MYRT|nr:hypothetical protein MLD38_027793 [Melastoma candidum]
MATAAASSLQQPVVIEITIISANGLRDTAPFPIFWKRPKRYVTMAPVARILGGRIKEADEPHPVYTTTVDNRGGTDPQWKEKFRITVETSFFANAGSSICVRVYSRGFARRVTQLGWCKIPAEDMLMSPPGKVGYLSYRLRNPLDGTRGHGIVNMAVKLEGLLQNARGPWFQGPGMPGPLITGFLVPSTSSVAIGFPVSLPPSKGV